jgi:putative FmdB family regulatory protein
VSIMLAMYKYACPDCGAVWSEVSDWSEPQVCPKCDREDVAPGVSHQVPPDVAREYLGRALASCRVMLDAWGTKSLTDLERAAQSCAESVTEFEVAVQTATLDGPAPTPADPPVVVVMDGGIVTNVYGPDVHVVVVDWNRMPGEQAGTFSVLPSSEMGKETAEVVARALAEEGVQA